MRVWTSAARPRVGNVRINLQRGCTNSHPCCRVVRRGCQYHRLAVARLACRVSRRSSGGLPALAGVCTGCDVRKNFDSRNGGTSCYKVGENHICGGESVLQLETNFVHGVRVQVASRHQPQAVGVFVPCRLAGVAPMRALEKVLRGRRIVFQR